MLPNLKTLGSTLAFIMLNRPTTVSVFIQSMGSSDTTNNVQMPLIQFVPDGRDMNGVQGWPIDTEPTNYTKRIRVFHVHAHFDLHSEREAILLHQALRQYLEQDLDEDELPGGIRYYKNGPHDKWNWEVHIQQARTRTLAAAVVFLARNLREGMYHPFHCRTFDIHSKNEYNDHAFRLGWIGPIDPLPLDINFFAH